MGPPKQLRDVFPRGWETQRGTSSWLTLEGGKAGCELGCERGADHSLGNRTRGSLPHWDGLEFVTTWMCECFLRTQVGQMGKNWQGIILGSIQ